MDSGPLIALVDRDDQHHQACVTAFRRIQGKLLGTVWPVLTEVMHFLDGIPGAQQDVWEMLARGAVRLLPLGPEDIPRIRQLMQQYSNRPMDLADAALMRVAERHGIRHIFTVDRKDFSVYRIHGRIKPVIFP